MNEDTAVILRPYTPVDIPQMTQVWNQVIEQADSFPWEEPMERNQAELFFAKQTRSIVACMPDGKIAGCYILHPNNEGRCAHTANASYGVLKNFRGLGIGRALVEHSLEAAAACGFLGLQFNAVVSTNKAAISLYRKLGFRLIGATPQGYRLKDGSYVDLYLFHKILHQQEA